MRFKLFVNVNTCRSRYVGCPKLISCVYFWQSVHQCHSKKKAVSAWSATPSRTCNMADVHSVSLLRLKDVSRQLKIPCEIGCYYKCLPTRSSCARTRLMKGLGSGMQAESIDSLSCPRAQVLPHSHKKHSQPLDFIFHLWLFSTSICNMSLIVVLHQYLFLPCSLYMLNMAWWGVLVDPPALLCYDG